MLCPCRAPMFFFIFQTSKQSVMFLFLSSCSKLILNWVIFIACILLTEEKAHRQLSHPPENNADDCQEWQQHTSKQDPLNSWISSLDFSGYYADFHEGHGMSEHGRGTERHVRISATRHDTTRHDTARHFTTGALNVMCELDVRPIWSTFIRGTAWHVYISFYFPKYTTAIYNQSRL
jgi:hypothetical protein